MADDTTDNWQPVSEITARVLRKLLAPATTPPGQNVPTHLDQARPTLQGRPARATTAAVQGDVARLRK